MTKKHVHGKKSTSVLIFNYRNDCLQMELFKVGVRLSEEKSTFAYTNAYVSWSKYSLTLYFNARILIISRFHFVEAFGECFVYWNKSIGRERRLLTSIISILRRKIGSKSHACKQLVSSGILMNASVEFHVHAHSTLFEKRASDWIGKWKQNGKKKWRVFN